MDSSEKVLLKKFAIGFCLGGIFAVVIFFHSDEVISNQKADLQRSLIPGTPKIQKLEDAKGEKHILMNDPSIQKNWGLMGTQGKSDIKANKAWDVTTGDRDIRVAIIDTGVDVRHHDLNANIWKNPGETGTDKNGKPKETNGIDDDGNGFVDDINGWDFATSSPRVVDSHGHGTHIAGIIGAVGGNGIGVVGVCPKVSLMVLKYYDPNAKGNDNLKNTIRAIKYAVDNGAHIINYSGGGTEPNDDEFKAIQYAREKGVLVVAAAGNEKSNSDLAPYYPADYNLDNIISVTAIDSYARVLNSSNYGTKSVHIAAPGKDIYSTLPGNQGGTMTGTSQATAFVSGVAALILAHNKTFAYKQVREQIVKTSDEIPELRGKTKFSGKLNSYAALTILPMIPASGIANVSNNSAGSTVLGASNGNQFLRNLVEQINSSSVEKAPAAVPTDDSTKL